MQSSSQEHSGVSKETCHKLYKQISQYHYESVLGHILCDALIHKRFFEVCDMLVFFHTVLDYDGCHLVSSHQGPLRGVDITC